MLKILKKLGSRFVKWSISSHECQFNHLKYCFFRRNNSKVLLVVFSGFPGKGNAARYNYVRTLSGIKANKLFLLDDIENPVNTGSYYLGKDGDWYLSKDVVQLIAKIVKENDIQKVITLGSSKDGTSALLFGLKTEADACIIGAPQYYIGNYLSSEEHRPILETIMGDGTQESIDKLNGVVTDEIFCKHNKKPTVYIHYSPNEHTYQDHICDMIRDLRQAGYSVNEDNRYHYTKHSDVANHFPRYLLARVKECINNNQA